MELSGCWEIFLCLVNAWLGIIKIQYYEFKINKAFKIKFDSEIIIQHFKKKQILDWTDKKNMISTYNIHGNKLKRQ